MLKINQISKSYGTRVLFDDVTFTLTPGERLGLVGRNGCGKTTLLRLVLGEEIVDEGTVELPPHYSVGHLSQHLNFTAKTVLEECCLGLPIQEGDWVEEYLAEQALMGLGFSIEDFQLDPNILSGGLQVRLQLAKTLVSAPNLLLLDEPTNYLDIVTMRWLERYLRNWDGEVILITHDREFMDRVVTHSMIIHRGKTRRIKGSTVKLRNMLEQEEEIHEKTRLNQAKSRKDDERFVERFRYTASKARQVQSRIKMLEKQGTIDALSDIANLSFKFNAAKFNAHTLFEVEDLKFGYEGGPILFEGLKLDIKMGDRIAVIGKNGKGKSTLLNLIAGELQGESTRFKTHNAVRIGHFGQTNINRLTPGLTIEEEILSVIEDNNVGRARGICGLMMFREEDALKRVEVISGGERARVLLGKLLVSPTNMILLDEPTNHLDMESIDSLTAALRLFPGGSVVVTHNELVLHALATKLVIFDNGKATVFDGTYREFLDSVGWSDEDDGKKNKKQKGTEKQTRQQNKPNNSSSKGKKKKADRKERDEMVAARGKALRPLKLTMDKLEVSIIALEAKLEVTNSDLADAATFSDSEGIVRLSTAAAELQKQIDADFAQLEAVTSEHDQKSSEFEERLSA